MLKFHWKYTKNTTDISKIKLLKQDWPTCWWYSVLNNFQLQTNMLLSKRDIREFREYSIDNWLDLEKWWQPILANVLLTLRWNDVKGRKPIMCYYINDLTKTRQLYQFIKMLLLWNIFQYSRSSWDDFKKDRKDLVLDKEDYAKTDKWHAVNIWLDKYRFKEYGSYGSSKYNILWITIKAFLWLLRWNDIKKSVYFFKKV